jgi:hypothetical protein
MKKVFVIAVSIVGLVFLIGGVFAALLSMGSTMTEEVEVAIEEIEEVAEEIVMQEEGKDYPIYVLYSLNVHDWVHPEESAEAVRKVILLHEEYQIPVEVYVTDPVFQLYVENDPELIELMKRSSMTSISYHIRAPVPYYGNYDWYGLSQMNNKDRENLLRSYEEHRLDLETGMPTDEPGGYQFVKDVIGYAPRIVGIFDSVTGGQVLVDIYKEKGVSFVVQHNKQIDVGDKKFGVSVRPEHYGLKIYEYAGKGQSAEEIFEMVTEQLVYEHPQFIGVKYHENNFYHDDNPWFAIFWEQAKEKTGVKSPPYDLSLALDDFRTDEEIASHWTLYEDSLKYVSEHVEEYEALNAVGLMEEFKWK